MRKRLSSEFKIGFVGGYTSCSSFLFQPAHHYTRPRKNIVALAWSRVGETLENSTKLEAAEIGKTPEEQRAG